MVLKQHACVDMTLNAARCVYRRKTHVSMCVSILKVVVQSEPIKLSA